MRTFGWAPSEGELQELVGEIDQVEKQAKKNLNNFLAKDGNGCITFNEFVWLMTRFQRQKLEVRIYFN